MNIPSSWTGRKIVLTVAGIVSVLAAWIVGDISAGQAIAAIVALITQYSAANVVEATRARHIEMANAPSTNGVRTRLRRKVSMGADVDLQRQQRGLREVGKERRPRV